MKSTIPPHDQDIIELLEGLARFKTEYPPELLAARRAAFVAQIEQHQTAGVSKDGYLSTDRMMELLESLSPVVTEYPPELLKVRRAAFLAQIEQYNSVEAEEELPARDPVIKGLGNLKTAVDGYPSELMAARRAAFIAQIKQQNSVETEEELPAQKLVMERLGSLKTAVDEYPAELMAARRTAFRAQIQQQNRTVEQEALVPEPNGRLSKLLAHLKSIEIEYPLKLWKARRSAFVGQVRDGSRVSVLDMLRAAVQSILNGSGRPPFILPTHFKRTSMILATLLVMAFMSSLLYSNDQPFSGLLGAYPSQRDGSQPGQAALTSTSEVARIICKPGYAPPLCLARKFDKSGDLTFQGNGTARPAVAKDTIPGYSRIHQPAYVNDGLYGPGASWISNSAYSWIKLDLGEAKTINTVTFGRDRLGNFNDGDPGQFVVAVALTDNIYADGDSSNDSMEYTEVYNSDEVGFDGVVSGAETVEASFEPVTARFVKITFENARTAVDEIEVFMIQPPGFVDNSTRRPRDERATSTPIPTDTLVPTALPTNTLVPTFTSTPRPTNTPVPTFTNTPRPPTSTPTDIPPTDTPIPEPTDTPEPPPTDTPIPEPTDTPEPPPTDTPGPSSVLPTDTPVEVLEP